MQYYDYYEVCIRFVGNNIYKFCRVCIVDQISTVALQENAVTSNGCKVSKNALRNFS